MICSTDSNSQNLQMVECTLNDLEQHGYLEKTKRLRSNGGTTSNLYTVKQAQFSAKGKLRLSPGPRGSSRWTAQNRSG